jgi:hypothetical protein
LSGIGADRSKLVHRRRKNSDEDKTRDAPRSLRSALGRLHSSLTQQCRGFGRRHELDQFASRILILRHIADGDSEVAVFDKVRRQRAEILGAGDRLDHVGLLDADLDFAVSDCDRNGLALDDFDLVLDLVVEIVLVNRPEMEAPEWATIT